MPFPGAGYRSFPALGAPFRGLRAARGTGARRRRSKPGRCAAWPASLFRAWIERFQRVAAPFAGDSRDTRRTIGAGGAFEARGSSRGTAISGRELNNSNPLRRHSRAAERCSAWTGRLDGGGRAPVSPSSAGRRPASPARGFPTARRESRDFKQHSPAPRRRKRARGGKVNDRHEQKRTWCGRSRLAMETTGSIGEVVND